MCSILPFKRMRYGNRERTLHRGLFYLCLIRHTHWRCSLISITILHIFTTSVQALLYMEIRGLICSVFSVFFYFYDLIIREIAILRLVIRELMHMTTRSVRLQDYLVLCFSFAYLLPKSFYVVRLQYK